jgi:hypothetical protein
LRAALRAAGLTNDEAGNLIDVCLPGDIDRDGDVDHADMPAPPLDRPTLTARCDPR